jgi:alkylation response protein AidB-like acyl-CoA dehydrogenase
VAEVRAFLRDNLPADWSGIGALSAQEYAAFIEEWRTCLVRQGYLAPAWPVEYGGGGYTSLEASVLAGEFARAGVPIGGPNDEIGIDLFGNTVLKWGTEQQRAYYLPRVISGADRWCQGYSEPDAGSDLAALTCRAHLDGDEWVIDGQKIWTSRAMTADWIFLLVRTDADAPKHRGLSFLLCPLDQPGVEVWPIQMMSGAREFCQVFFTGARTAAGNIIGAPGQGWSVGLTLLAHERGSSAITMPIIFRTELDRLMQLARECGANRDPLIRQRLAASYTRVEALRFLGLRTVDALSRGDELGVEASIFKVCWSEHHKEVTELALSILGPRALTPTGRKPLSAIRTDEPGAPNSSMSWVDVFFNARAGTIYAGTSEIQRNILGERMLGLPREPAAEANSK